MAAARPCRGPSHRFERCINSSAGVSVFYLAMVSLTLLVQPFLTTPALELMQRSNLWLGPLQGLAAATLGAFFRGN